MDVNPPDVLRVPLTVPQKILMGAGPSNCSENILRAVNQPLLGHMHEECLQIMDEIKEGIRYIFQTKNDLTLALSSSGHGGIETILCNLLEKNDRVLITNHGYWGERVADMASRYWFMPIKMEKRPGDNFTLDEFEGALKLHKPKMLFVIQGETTTGVYQEIDKLGKLCHRYNCLLALDTVASLGSVPLFVDRWEIDAIYTGSQKGLSGPPGITPISFSKRAVKVLFARKTPVPVYYFDMKLIGQYWGCFPNKPRIYHHTISATLLYGLRECLAEFVIEGYEKVIARHQLCADKLQDGLERLGLELFVKEKSKRLPTITTVYVPKDMKCKEIIDYLMKRHKFEISSGLGPTHEIAFRIGLMGTNARPERVDAVLKHLSEITNIQKQLQYNSKL